MLYIAYITSHEIENILRDMKKEDTLVLYYSSDEQSIPVGEIQAFMSTKGTVSFKEYINDIVTSFEIGEMFSENPSVSIVDSGTIGATEVFSALNSYLNQKNPTVKQKKARKKKVAIAADPIIQTPSQLELPLSLPSAQKEATLAPVSQNKEAEQPSAKKLDDPAETKGNPGKKAENVAKTKKASKGKDITIDPKFTSYIKSLGIDGYNDTYPTKIFSAIGFSHSTGIQLEKALGSEFSAIRTKQILDALDENGIAKLTELWGKITGE